MPNWLHLLTGMILFVVIVVSMIMSSQLWIRLRRSKHGLLILAADLSVFAAAVLLFRWDLVST